MYQGHLVKVFVPYGRRKTVSILLQSLRRFRSTVDEVMLWMNTDEDQQEDVVWAHEMARAEAGWVNLYNLGGQAPWKPKQLNTGRFYPYCTEPDTIYVRFDDDVVFIDDAYFENLLRFRLDNPRYLLIFGHIWNNAILSYVDQQLGHLDRQHGVVERPYCMDPVGWQSPVFAEYLHEELLRRIEAGTTEELFWDRYELPPSGRFSISNFAFFGRDCLAWGGMTEPDEEIYLTETYPRRAGRLSAICGGALVSHYSFFGQRPHLEQTDILERYRRIADDRLSRDYYTLLAAADARAVAQADDQACGPGHRAL